MNPKQRAKYREHDKVLITYFHGRLLTDSEISEWYERVNEIKERRLRPANVLKFKPRPKLRRAVV